MHKRHLFYYKFLLYPVKLFLLLKFGYRCKMAKNLPDTSYIVLSNHTTDYDPILVASSFRRQMYFVASEHIARWPLAYKFIKYCFAPITRYKGSTAASTVMEMVRALRAGRNVCMFAEGNRSWDGVTAPISPATGKVVKSAKCALVTYKITGGYFVSPRWSKQLRKGKLYGAPVQVYTKEQIEAMTVEEVNRIIAQDLYEDANARQQEDPKPYRGKGLAEGMERLLFICPKCGAIDSMDSRGDKVSCRECDLSFRYTEYGMLEGLEFHTMRELAQWQKEALYRLAREEFSLRAQSGNLVTVAKSVASSVAEGPVFMSREKLSCGEFSVSLEEILDMEMHGSRTLVFSTRDAYYELKPSEESNVLKFQWLYHVCKER